MAWNDLLLWVSIPAQYITIRLECHGKLVPGQPKGRSLQRSSGHAREVFFLDAYWILWYAHNAES
jgi:hypothetical protein